MSNNIDTLSAVSRRQLYHAYREAYGEKPLDVHAQMVQRTVDIKRYLYRLAVGCWDFRVPDTFNKKLTQSSLIYGGAFAVAEYKGYLVSFPFSVIERHATHLPRVISCADGSLSFSHPLIVGDNCEIVYLDYVDAYCGGYESYAIIIDIYAQKLANCDASVDINLINTRAPFIFEVSNSKEAEDMKALYTRITSGQPAVFWRRFKNALDKREPLLTRLPIQENYIAGDIVELKQSIIGEYLAEIGVNTVAFEKKERLLTDEVNANNHMIDIAVTNWRDNVKEGCERVQRRFNVAFEISWRDYNNNLLDEVAKNDTRLYDGA